MLKNTSQIVFENVFINVLNGFVKKNKCYKVDAIIFNIKF